MEGSAESEAVADTKFIAVVQLSLEHAWYGLDRRTRKDYSLQMAEIVAPFPAVQCRWFDAEAWTGTFSDFVICEFEDLAAYHQLWLELRDHPFLATPYARIEHVSMGMEQDSPEPDEEPAEVRRVCPNCQVELRSKARFCNHCGQSASQV